MADYDLANYAQSLDPAQAGAMAQQAQLLRGRQAQQDALMQANARAHGMDPLAAIAQMANNPGVAAAAKLAAHDAQSRYKPLNLGAQGFALPDTGTFVESPMYVDEKTATRDARKQALEQQAQERRFLLQQTLGARQEQAAMMEEGRNDRAEQANALRMTMAQMANEARADRAAASAAAKAAKGADGKTLPASEVRKLTDKEGLASTFGDLVTGFKPEYAGAPIVTGLQNTLGKMGVKKYSDQANWWQNYNEQSNQVRHQLFGSALTATEQAAYNKAAITEDMAPAEIKTRLAQQHEQATKAFNKLKNSYGKAGYNTGNFEDLGTPQSAMPGGQPRAPKAAGGRIKFDAQGNEVQ